MKIVKHCHACQLRKRKPVDFRVPFCDRNIGKFKHVMQLNVMALRHDSVLHVMSTETGFQNGAFISKIDAGTAWQTMRSFRINLYPVAPDYFHTDLGTNFNS